MSGLSCGVSVHEIWAARALEQSTARKIPTLIMFYSPECPHCHETRPEVEALSMRLCRQVDIRVLDVLRFPAVAEAQRITNLPTFVLFREGEALSRWTGYHTVEQLGRKLKSALGGS